LDFNDEYDEIDYGSGTPPVIVPADVADRIDTIVLDYRCFNCNTIVASPDVS